MRHLVQGHSAGFALQYLKATDGAKEWHHAYNFPTYGYEVTYTSTGNRQQLGSQYSSSFILRLPLHHRSDSTLIKGFKHYLNLGIGAGYATKIWDLRENNKSLVLGSHLNASVVLHYEVVLANTSNWQLTAGLRVHHFSNGAFQLPNLGTNNLSLSVGMVRQQKPKQLISIQRKMFEKNWKNSISFVGGLKEIAPPTGRKYSSFTLSYLRERHFTFKSAIGGGVDFMMNDAVRALRNRYENTELSPLQSSQLGLVISYGMYFHQFQFKIQQGIYVVRPYSGDGLLYHRVALRYPITPKLLVNLGLKTHFAKADHAELGLTYQL